jgi:hypothetical protein
VDFTPVYDPGVPRKRQASGASEAEVASVCADPSCSRALVPPGLLPLGRSI